ncbi:P27 family phage terminase small subunit [Anaerovibrio sp. JC8]|uniref:P27 family phage terminase small subunit n=1 Tax=Anaerovibrio sp. JC8 TaxID=1240085 RepID=UPI000A0F796A|nr:P27 family phage terminase small subunit [Anaerovibrio sp. JC8]
MARPAKPTKTTRKHLTKAEKATREAIENLITDGLPDTPPEEFSQQRQTIYSFIVEILRPTGLLKSIDYQTIKQACIIIDRLNQVNTLIDQAGLDTKLLRTQEQLIKQYWKVTDLLCMSPQARAKVGAMVANQEEQKDPLAEILEGLENEE